MSAGLSDGFAASVRGFAPLLPGAGVPVCGYAKPARLQPIDLHLDSNEGAWVPRGVIEDMAAGAVTSGALRQYPSTSALETELASALSVSADQVLVTAGADDALDRVAAAALTADSSAPAFGRQTGRAVLTTPTFEMIGRYVRLRGGRPVEVPWLDGPLPVGRICEAIAGAPEGTEDAVESVAKAAARVVFLVTPNNPTGAVVSPEEVATVLEVCQRFGSILCIDQAYGEFADHDLSAQFAGQDNVVVTRTFSKAWGLAGLRIGYAVGDRRIIAWMRAVGQPFAASGVSLSIARQWLAKGHPVMQDFVQRVRADRNALTRRLRASGVDVIESQANFVLASFPDRSATPLCRGNRAQLASDLLASQGIAVRGFPGGGLASMLRITLPGCGAAMARLETALDGVLQRGQGIFTACDSAGRVSAAKSLGQFPIGVLPGGLADPGAEALLRAGAARVVSSLAELSSIISEANS